MLPAEVFERRLRQAVKSSTFMVQDEAQARHNFISRTSQLERAIDTRFDFDNGNNVGVVYLDDRAAPYGVFVHEGTRPHIIRPKTKSVLRWAPMAGNGFIFSKEVHHPGTKSDPFLYDAINRKRGDVYATFAKATNMALEDISDSDWLGKTDHEIKIRL